MRLAAIVTLAAMAVVSARGQLAGGREITVYIHDDAGVPFLVKDQAQRFASDTFSSIGVTVHWRLGAPASGAIMMDLLTKTPAEQLPGALAYAMPGDGVHIGVFWDRIKPGSCASVALGYVMVHEITHILQGVPRHSGEGIMKAHWDAGDWMAMKVHGLGFTQEDVELIYSGMEARRARLGTSGD